MTSYDDSYSTCARTFVTLRAFSATVTPEEVTELLRITPTRAARGKLHAWLLSSEPHLQSRDARRHLDWLLRQLVPERERIESLLARGVHIDVMCAWYAHASHGGPTLSRAQFSELASLGLDLWFDFYPATPARTS